MSTPELASSYAALILADDGVEITVSFPALQHDPAAAAAEVPVMGDDGYGAVQIRGNGNTTARREC